MSKTSITADKIRDAIVAHYLETGSGCDAKQLAERVGCSESTIRKHLDACGGTPRGCVMADAYRDRFSKDYPMMQTGVTKVLVHEPSKSTLRDLLLAARAEIVKAEADRDAERTAAA